MSNFKTARHLGSWAGVCPGNNQSAGRSRSARNPRGNRFIKRILVQVALAAAQTRKAYARALYQRIAIRRGKGRAILAVANSLIQAIWYMLSQKVKYEDLGIDYYQRQDQGKKTRSLVKQLERLGHRVTLEPAA